MERESRANPFASRWNEVKQGRLSPAELRRVYETMGAVEGDHGGEPPVHSLVPIQTTLRAMAKEMPPEGRGLDLGCGSNPHGSFLLEGVGHRVVATEFAMSYARLAKGLARARGSGVDFVVCDGRFLPFRPGAFTTVLVSEVLEHIPDDRAAVGEIFDVLAAGGRVFVTVPNRDSLPLWIRRLADRIRDRRFPDDWYSDPGHSDLRRYDQPALDHLFQKFLRHRRYRVVPYQGSATGLILALAMHFPFLRGMGLSVAASYEKMAHGSPPLRAGPP